MFPGVIVTLTVVPVPAIERDNGGVHVLRPLQNPTHSINKIFLTKKAI